MISGGMLEKADFPVGEIKKTFAWNTDTMSQNLRKMQYAVRGQVVLKADILKNEGRQIIFTVSDEHI